VIFLGFLPPLLLGKKDPKNRQIFQKWNGKIADPLSPLKMYEFYGSFLGGHLE
jgi:hypothetical protein